MLLHKQIHMYAHTPGVSWRRRQWHVLENCICSSLKRLIWRQQRTPERPDIPLPTSLSVKQECLEVNWQRHCVYVWLCVRYICVYLDSAQIHGVLDDVVIVMQLQPLSVHWLVERPGVGRMFFRQQFFQDVTAVFQLFVRPACVCVLLLLLRVTLSQGSFTWVPLLLSPSVVRQTADDSGRSWSGDEWVPSVHSFPLDSKTHLSQVTVPSHCYTFHNHEKDMIDHWPLQGLELQEMLSLPHCAQLLIRVKLKSN